MPGLQSGTRDALLRRLFGAAISCFLFHIACVGSVYKPVVEEVCE